MRAFLTEWVLRYGTEWVAPEDQVMDTFDVRYYTRLGALTCSNPEWGKSGYVRITEKGKTYLERDDGC